VGLARSHCNSSRRPASLQQNNLALQNAKFSLPIAPSPRKSFKLTLDFLFVDAELCPSEIQDLAGNILEIRKAGGQNQTKDAFGFELRSLDVSAAAEIVNRLSPLLSTTCEGRK
jgi:hypothetical protein